MPATPAWPPKSLPRLFVRHPLSEGARVELDAAQANYLGNVMRLGVDAQVLLFDGSSGEWLARIAVAGKKRMTLAVEMRTREPESIPDVWLAFAPVKRAQTDWLAEKATELGAARLIPVITQRTIAERVKLERLAAIAIEAAEQCGRTLVPGIAELLPLQKLLQERDPARTLYFADEGGARVTSGWRPDWLAVALAGMVLDLVGEVGDQLGSLCQVGPPDGMVMQRWWNAREPGQRTWVGRRQRWEAPVKDGGHVACGFEVASGGGCQHVAERVFTGFGREAE